MRPRWFESALRRRHTAAPRGGPSRPAEPDLLRTLRRRSAEQWPRALALALIVAALLPLFGRAGATTAATAAASIADEWPTVLDGASLRPLGLSAVEQRFADRFPGRIGRFEAGAAVWVLRDVRRPTRALHPASDCFRGLGYRIDSIQLEADAASRRWRCFVATRNGERLRVCERIVDQGGEQAFTDASDWFWAASLGRSPGPWRAMTRVEAL